MAIFSTRARYALHGLAYVAARAEERRLVPFREIQSYLEDYAGETSVSAGYIAKIMQDVARSGMTVGGSGPKGGYRLARTAGDISLLDVVEAVDGPISTGCCLLAVDICPGMHDCGVRAALSGVEETMRAALAKRTVAELAGSVGPRVEAKEAKR